MKIPSSFLVFAALAATNAARADHGAADFKWTGFYMGVQGGVAFNTSDAGRLAFDSDLDGAFDDAIGAFGSNFAGKFDAELGGGLHAGYDRQFGRWVIGGVADVTWIKLSQQQSGFTSTPAFYTEDRSIDYLATVRLRAGYLLNERVLGYVTAGASFADVEHRFLSNTGATVATSGGNDEETGAALGAGVEVRITPAWSLGIEYLNTDLGTSDFVTNLRGPAAFSAVAGSTNTVGSDRDFDFENLQVKLSFRF